MSSPIFASSLPSGSSADPRRRSSSFAAPKLDLVLRPSYSLGPFKLGHSLWHVLNYLRSQQSLFPQINIVWDEVSPRHAPITVVIQPNLHLVFNGITQRLVMITLENLDQAPSPATPTTASSQPSHRPINLVYNGKIIHSRGTSRSPSVALNRSTLHQILGPTYPGYAESTSIASDSLVAKAYGSKADGPVKHHDEFVVTYPGLAFCFALKPNTAKDADVDKFQPVSTIHIFSGTDPHSSQDVLVSPVVPASLSDTSRSSTRTNKGTLSPTAPVSDYQQLNSERDRAALETDAIHVRCPTLLEANVNPGKSVSLHFAKSTPARTASPLADPTTGGTPDRIAMHVVKLILGVTTPQDAMCDLGQPQRIFYKEDDRMRIHGSQAPSAGQNRRRPQERGSEHSNVADESLAGSADHDDSAFFYNYFDLGIDLLFSKHTARMPSIGEVYGAVIMGQARLEKVICHSNVPGDALFQRYNRCPWRVVPGASAAEGSKTTSTSKTKTQGRAPQPFSFEDHFDSTLAAGEDDRGMELDRGTCAEFRGSGGGLARKQAGKTGAGDESSPEREQNPAGEVIVDLSTRLVGREGMVLEVGKDGSMVGVVVF